MPFVTEYRPSVPNLKNNLMSKWHWIENQPLIREIYKDPLLLSLTEKGGLWKTYKIDQSFKGQSVLILTNKSHVWPVNHLYHQFENTISHGVNRVYQGCFAATFKELWNYQFNGQCFRIFPLFNNIVRLQARVFYEQIVNEGQPSWLSLLENSGS